MAFAGCRVAMTTPAIGNIISTTAVATGHEERRRRCYRGFPSS